MFIGKHQKLGIETLPMVGEMLGQQASGVGLSIRDDSQCGTLLHGLFQQHRTLRYDGYRMNGLLDLKSKSIPIAEVGENRLPKFANIDFWKGLRGLSMRILNRLVETLIELRNRMKSELAGDLGHFLASVVASRPIKEGAIDIEKNRTDSSGEEGGHQEKTAVSIWRSRRVTGPAGEDKRREARATQRSMRATGEKLASIKGAALGMR